MRANVGGTVAFDETFTFQQAEDEGGQLVTLQVWDKDTLFDVFMGEAEVDLRTQVTKLNLTKPATN